MIPFAERNSAGRGDDGKAECAREVILSVPTLKITFLPITLEQLKSFCWRQPSSPFRFADLYSIPSNSLVATMTKSRCLCKNGDTRVPHLIVDTQHPQ